jgi:hypothetical protein
MAPTKNLSLKRATKNATIGMYLQVEKYDYMPKCKRRGENLTAAFNFWTDMKNVGWVATPR